MEQQKIKLNYKDIIIVEDFDEAEQFRYEDNNQPVEILTPVGYEVNEGQSVTLKCFDGIYYKEDGYDDCGISNRI